MSAPAILLVEKDAVTLEMYQRELSKSFTVHALTDLRRSHDILASQAIQAIVIEPEIDPVRAWALIQSIQTLFPQRPIPIIVCSTRDAAALAPGPAVARYLTKPVLPSRLRAITLEVLASNAVPGAAL
jgi:DNA-binding response OmpR family regulator